MGTRGRASAASLAVVGAAELIQRIPPTADLTAEHRAIWLRTVNSKPADWFGEEHIPLLTQYVRHVVVANTVAKQIEEFDMSWMADEDGLKRYDRLTTIHARETAHVNSLARAMRLTQQSTIRADAAGAKKRQGRKPWQTLEADEA